MQNVQRCLHVIDTINVWLGHIVCVLAIPIMIITTTAVTLRYVFNRPTIWAWDVNTQLMLAMVLLGAGYTLLSGIFIRVDILYRRFPIRMRAIVDMVTALLFFSFWIVLLWQGTDFALRSIEAREVMPTRFHPPLYPVKTLMPIGAFFMLLQGLAGFIRNLTTAVTGRENSL